MSVETDVLVSERYTDALGSERIVPARTRDTFLALLDANAAAPAYLAPSTVVVEGDQTAVVTALPAASWTERLAWTITREDGGVERGQAELRDAPVIASEHRDGTTIDRRRIPLPPLPLGYHRIAADCGPYGRAEAALIVVPPSAYLPPGDGRVWGLAVQLYTIRSARNWGIGDFGDLRRIIELAADAGASYVGLNPLHAPHRSDPDAASPYAPTSRRFLNWLMIDVPALPEAADPAIAAALAEPELRAQLERLRAPALVDYNGVAEIKDALLRRCFAVFRERTPKDPSFRAFVAGGGIALERFAIFETLVERLGRDISAWPPAYRDPAAADVKAFADAERPAIEYALYLQWRADGQLAQAAAEGAARGVALYRDLAVGVDANGADVWVDAHAYVPSASAGAPPDVLNTAGQDWGLPPLDPSAVARDGYRTFAELVRANMRDAGALRIDHAMSLRRLFWIPRGAPADTGAYVTYPIDDLTGIVALESVRANCVVIGEDLGTVPAGFRERMARAHVLSYRILFFERDADGAFVPPERYPALALAASGTHDLPPFASWLAGSDIDLRQHLGFLDETEAAREKERRAADRCRLVGTLVAAGDLAPADAAPASAVIAAAHRYLARSPARIVMLQIDDAIGESEPVNVPGTSDQYPNWRRKLRLDIEEVAANPDFQTVTSALRAARPKRSTT